MSKDITRVVGMDVSDRFVHLCVLLPGGEIEEESRLSTSPEALRRWFGKLGYSRVALEVGTHSPWIGRLLVELGHEVILANPSRVRSIYESNNKSDRVDAEMLARLARSDPKLLYPVEIRSEECQRGLMVIRARRVLVESRTKLVSHVRGVCKSLGVRLPKCDAASFHRSVRQHVPEDIYGILAPVFDQLEVLETGIKGCDRRIGEMARELEGAEVLQTVDGVGELTAVTFLLTLGDPSRFGRSREVGSYLGLRPRRSQSGEVDKQLRITRAGDSYLRSLLVNCAHRVLREKAPDSALRRWGLSIEERGGHGAKKRAVVAVARKLSVLLHRLWITGEEYRPFPQGDQNKAAA